MLILDKQKAVEHMVALAARYDGVPIPEERAPRQRGRSYQKVARYERRPPTTEDAPVGRRSRTRAGVSLHPANGITPV
jgi:hypothetical protein